MASKQPSTTTQIQKIELPEWVDKASQSNYALAEKLGSQPFQQYKGDRVADLGAMTQQGLKDFSSTTGSNDELWKQVQGIFGSMTKDANALKPTTVTADQTTAGSVQSGNTVSKDVVAQMLGDMDLSKYMNPYTNEVETKSLDALDRSRQQSILGNQGAAGAAGAFGGSRHGIVDAVTNSESANAAGLLSANLRKDNFNNATGLATADINRKLGADVGNADRSLNSDQGNMVRQLQALMSNRDAALTSDTGNAQRNLAAGGMNAQNVLDTFMSKSGVKNNAASGIMAGAQGQQQERLQDFAAMLQGGSLQQNQAQKELDSAREKFGESRNNDIDNLNLRLSALGMSPYGKTETTNKTTTGGQSGTDWGQMGMGIFSALLGLSEDDTKTDKEKVGKLPGTDLEMWAFRYKKDPKHYPKVVGVMASDVQKKMPDAVHIVDGKRVINYGMIGEAMAANG